MSIVFQKHHPYTGNLNSEMFGDIKNAFLRGGDVLGALQPWQQEYLLMIGMPEAQQFPPALAAESGECTRTQ